jgi:hypothetical protein
MPERRTKGAIVAEAPALHPGGIDGDSVRQDDEVGDAGEGEVATLGEAAIATRRTHVDSDPPVLQRDALGPVERVDREVRARHAAMVAEVPGGAPEAIATHRRLGAVPVEDLHLRTAVRGKEQDAMNVQASGDGQDQGALVSDGDRQPVLVDDREAVLTAMHHRQIERHGISRVRWA